MLPVRLHPDADQEAIAAAPWIKADDPKEGMLFVKALKEALQRATCQPEVYRCFHDDLRSKFSYGVIFRVKADEAQVLAVAHLHRRPGHWRDRARRWPGLVNGHRASSLDLAIVEGGEFLCAADVGFARWSRREYAQCQLK